MKTKLLNTFTILGLVILLASSAIQADETKALTEAVKKDLHDFNNYSPFRDFYKQYPASKDTWEYLEAESEKRLDEWKKAAEAGIPEGQVLLGLSFLRPSNARVEEKREEMVKDMVKLFRKAAEQGNADGQFWYGNWAHYDLDEAERKQEGHLDYLRRKAEWHRKAAEQGHARAQLELAEALYYTEFDNNKGTWTPGTDAERAKWFRLAAEQGLVEAQWYAGMSYRGWGDVPSDPEKAAQWYLKAAEQGLPQAMAQLGLFYREGKGVPQDDTKAAEWFQKAAELGDSWGEHYLGECYLEGNGVPQDTEKAVEWFRKAASNTGQKFPNAYYKLGWCYATGTGVLQDTEEAKRWLREAEEKFSFRSLSWGYVNEAAALLKKIEKSVD